MSTRVLITGFTPFPGAEQNPTGTLVAMLRANPPDIAGAELRAEVLPTAYRRVAAALAAVAEGFEPDIVLHFGLAREARGFRLEACAHNTIVPGRPDAEDYTPGVALVSETHEPRYETTLPLAALKTGLEDLGLPVEMSRDAGGYVCNYTLYHTLGGLIPGLRPQLAGFVHVSFLARRNVASPCADEGAEESAEEGAGEGVRDDPPCIALTRDELWRGAVKCAEICVEHLSRAAERRIDADKGGT